MKRNFFYSKTNRAKSVRKNCFWTEVNNTKYLVSYQTVVACIDKDGYFHKFWNNYSATTTNQINQFIHLFGDVFSEYDGTLLNGFNKKDWLSYPTGLVPKDDLEVIKPLIPKIEWSNYGYSCYDYATKFIYS